MDQLEKDVLEDYNKNTYTRLGSDVSVTELLNPPRIIHLSDRHRTNVAKTNLSEIIASKIGSGVHDQLQKHLRNNSSWKIERKVLSVIDGVRITGRFDALFEESGKDTSLYDIKVTKTYKMIMGNYTEWEQQLNIYDWMLWKDGIDVKALKIFMVLLDWNKGSIWKKGYPPGNINIIPIAQWTRNLQEEWLLTRIKSWKSSKVLKNDELPLCTPKERWADDPNYKLFREPSLKKATKVFKTKERAEAYMKACQINNPKTWGDAVIKVGNTNQWRRCDWCNGQSFCNQYKNKLEE